jgi:hypothetical protein
VEPRSAAGAGREAPIRPVRRPKLPVWAALPIAGVVFALYVLPGGVVFLMVFAVVVWPVLEVRGWYLLRSLRERRLELDDGEIRVFEANGRLLGSIDRSRPSTYELLYRDEGRAVYRLRQEDARLDFGSRSTGAERVVREALELEWPPVNRAARDLA